MAGEPEEPPRKRREAGASGNGRVAADEEAAAFAQLGGDARP